MKLIDVTNLLGITSLDRDKPQDIQTPRVLKAPQETPKTLYTWTAVSRPEKKGLDQKKLRTLIIIGIMVSLLLVAMQQFFMILAVLSLIFVVYMLGQVPPEEMTYEINTQGVKYGNLMYYWEELKYFFPITENNHEVLAIDLVNGIPGRLFFTVTKENKKKVTDLLKDYVNYLDEAPKSFIDKAYDSMTEKIALDRTE